MGDELRHHTSPTGIALRLNFTPECGRVVTTFFPATIEKVGECIHLRRLAMGSGPFRKLSGTKETPDSFPLDMQGAADFSLGSCPAERAPLLGGSDPYGIGDEHPVSLQPYSLS